MLTYEQAHKVLRYDEATGELYWKVDVARNVCAGMLAGKIRKRDSYKNCTLVALYKE